MAENLKQIAHMLRGMEARADQLAPVWPRVGRIIARMNGRAFATKGASTGKPWKPLAATTLARKKNRQWLVESGAMKKEFTGNPMAVEQYWGKQALFGAASRVAKWQQGGTFQHGKRHIPPRVIQRLTPEDRKKIKDQVVQWIFKGKL